MRWEQRFSLARKTALVTGSSSGIGTAIAEVFADAGAGSPSGSAMAAAARPTALRRDGDGAVGGRSTAAAQQREARPSMRR